MGIFDEEVTPDSLEDIGFVSIGKGKWMYIFASQCYYLEPRLQLR